MIYTPLTREALNIAYRAHSGQLDESGIPYIFHPYEVAGQMDDEISVCVALLHDVMEDTAVTYEELAEHMPEEVMEPLKLLKHDPAENYMEYIDRLKKNPVARRVKLADIAHNSNEHRLDGVQVSEDRLRHWREKYAAARKALLEQETCE